MIGMPTVTDAYLMWTISDGGDALGTDMPAYADALTQEQRWQLLGYMQNGFRKAE